MVRVRLYGFGNIGVVMVWLGGIHEVTATKKVSSDLVMSSTYVKRGRDVT